MVTVLITGFGPFPGAPVNPTTALVARLARSRRFGSARIVSHVFATRYSAADADLARLIDEHRPDIVVLFGLAARRRHVSIETRARNRISLWFPDAGGATARRAAIEAGGPPERRGRAPMPRLLTAARAARVEAKLSRDAGRYVCNYAYWHALAAAETAGGPRAVVFVHVPKLRGDHVRSRPGRRRYALPDLVRAGEAVVAAVLAAARAGD